MSNPNPTEPYGWWSLTGKPGERIYAYGAESDADRYCKALSRGRDIDVCARRWLGETDEEAQAAEETRVVDIRIDAVQLDDVDWAELERDDDSR